MAQYKFRTIPDSIWLIMGIMDFICAVLCNDVCLSNYIQSIRSMTMHTSAVV